MKKSGFPLFRISFGLEIDFRAFRARASIQAIRRLNGEADLRSARMDLSSMDSIRVAAEEINSFGIPIHVSGSPGKAGCTNC